MPHVVHRYGLGKKLILASKLMEPLPDNQPESREQNDDVSRDDSDPITTLEKWLLLIGGVGAPVFTHLILIQRFGGNSWIGGPRYQTGLLKDKLAFLLTFDSLAWMYPLIFFSIIAFATLVVEIRYLGHASWARFGLLTGIPIGLAYHFVFLSQAAIDVQGMAVFHAVPIVGVLVVWGFAKLMMRLTGDRRIAWYVGLSILFGLSTFVSAIRVIVTGDHSNWALIAFPLFALLYGVILYGPIIWLGCYGWMIGRVMTLYPQARRFSLMGLMSWVTWIGGFFAASRYAVLKSFESYSRLPLNDPGTCYVATAACRGHCWLVRSSTTESGGRISPQLQTFKAIEIAMETLSPRFHRSVRRGYDAVGPVIARRVRAAWAADLIYLSLKPAEWGANLALRIGLGKECATVRLLYRPRVTDHK